MGQMIDGVWHTEDLPVADAKSGEFKRKASTFRNWMTADGAAGPSGGDGFPAAGGRYHLYVSWSCPWAHRTRLMRTLKGLEELIGMSVVAPRRDKRGWVFDNSPGSDQDDYRDTLYGKDAIHEFYSWADPDFTGRVTVPVLWGPGGARPSSTTKAAKSSRCSTAPLTACRAFRTWISIPRTFARRSMRSTTISMRISITASTAPASPRPRTPMMPPCRGSSPVWIG